MSSGGGASAFSFDLGNIFSGLGAEQKGTELCGSRPSCFWDGKNCDEKRKVYDACIMANVEAKNRMEAMKAKSIANRNTIITVAVVAVGLILVLSRVFKIGR